LASAKADAFDHLVETPRKLTEPRNVVLRIGRVVDLLRLRHQVRQLALNPEQLIDRVIVEAPGLAPHRHADEVIEDLVGQAILAGVAARVVTMERRVIVLEAREFLVRVRDRPVGQLRIVSMNTERFEQTDLRQELRVVDRVAHERPCVEPVDRQRLRVPRLRSKQCRRDD